MLRIAMLVFNQAGKGTYWRALALAQGLAEREHDLTLLATSPDRRRGYSVRQERGVTVVETPDLLPGSLRSGWDLWDAFSRIRWLRGRTFDLVHAFENRPVSLIPALCLQRRQGIPLVSDWCDWFGRGGSVEERPNAVVRAVLRPVETFLEETPRKRADGVTVINSVLRDKALALGLPQERVMMLPNGSNVREIVPGDRDAARRRLGLPSDCQLVAYTGAIFPRDALLMADAFNRMRAKNRDTRLLLVGYCNVDMRHLVKTPEAVIQTGPVSYAELSDYLAACDLGWLPLCDSGANRGRFPLKLNDFMAAGRAVVASDVADVGELIRDQPIGIVVPARPEPLAAAVLSLLEDDARRKALEHNTRKLAEAEFAWQSMAERLERFYYDVLGSDLARPVSTEAR